MNTSRLPVVVTALITGFFVAAQIAANTNVNSITSGNDFRVLAVETAELIKNIDKLENENKELSGQRDQLAKVSGESQDAVQKDINRLKVVTGQTQVTGEGIEVSFDRPLALAELIDLINALRNIGAEAIAVNEERVTAKTGFSDQGVNPPVVVKAIGKRELLAQAVSRRGGILEQIGHGKVSEQSNVLIPAVK